MFPESWNFLGEFLKEFRIVALEIVFVLDLGLSVSSGPAFFVASVFDHLVVVLLLFGLLSQKFEEITARRKGKLKK